MKQNGVSATDIQQAELGGEALVSIVNFIKNGVTKWYNYTLETFPILEQNEHIQDAMPSHQSINIHNPMIFKHTTGKKLSFIDHSPLHSPDDSTPLIDLDDLELAHTDLNIMLGHTIDGIV